LEVDAANPNLEVVVEPTARPVGEVTGQFGIFSSSLYFTARTNKKNNVSLNSSLPRHE
jgi:hypothetical protein